ncbi:MAG: rod shape-determining protein RodA [Lachnospiraceae bacterium]|nr:rod shape-determining protein RodA [Lachnospiraceae bacterium]
MLKRYRLKDFDYRLVIYLVVLTVLGILLIGSAARSKQTMQVIGLFLGITAMMVLSVIDYNYILQFYWIIYVVNIVLLVFVRIVGSNAGGATRWISILGIRFQPSELSKILLILFFAKMFSKYEDRLNDWKILLTMIVLAIVPLYLIKEQPDLSTSIVVAIIFCVMIYIAGLKRKIVLFTLGGVFAAFTAFIVLILNYGRVILNDYQYKRIMAWIDPTHYADTAYQQQNSIMAIGSGQLLGKGLNNNVISSVKNGNFISEPQTDFIFAVTGEELGFVGSCIIIILLLVISLECIKIGKKAHDLQGKLICCGMATLVGFQSYINICVATGLMPNTGLPLPFVSYGVTSLLTSFIGMGVVLNIGLQQRKY